jgi:hypothetical protein
MSELLLLGAISVFLAAGYLLYRLQEKRYAQHKVWVAWSALFTNVNHANHRQIWKRSLLILQGLALLLAILLLFNIPEMPISDKTIIIVLDQSLSMQAISNENTRTRFEQAKILIKKELSKDPTTQVKLYTFGGIPQNLPIVQLEQLEPGDVAGDLNDVLVQLHGESKNIQVEKMLIFTDHLTDEHQEKLMEKPFDKFPVKVHLIGGGKQNIYIEQFKVIGGFINRSPEQTFISYSFGNSNNSGGIKGDGSKEFRYTISLKDHNGKEHVWEAPKKVILETGQHRSGVYTIADLMKHWNLKKLSLPAEIHLKLIPLEGNQDDLSADNEAWELLPLLTPITLGVFDEGLFNFLEKELKIDNHSSEFIRRINVHNLSSGTKDGVHYDIAVFNQNPPQKGDSVKHISNLYILAHPPINKIKFPEDDVILRSQDQFLNEDKATLKYTNCEVISWKRNDDLMKYLDNFSIKRLDVSLYPFNWVIKYNSYQQERNYTPDWLKTILFGHLLTDDLVLSRLLIPIVMKGTFENKKVVVFNFDITKYNMSTYQNLKILLLNAIRGLYSHAKMPTSIRPEENFRISWKKMESASFNLEGQRINIPFKKQTIPPIKRSGIYTLTTNNSKLSHSFAVRMLENSPEHALKSSVSRDSEWDNGILNFSETTQTFTDNQNGILRWYIWLLLGIILLESLLYLFFMHTRLHQG